MIAAPASIAADTDLFTANVEALTAAQPFPAEWFAPDDESLEVDERDGWLGVVGTGGEWVPLHAPARLPQVSRWIDAALGSSVPGAVAIGGIGRGDVIDILTARNPAVRIIVIEPEAGLLRWFLSARSWVREIEERRLMVIGRGEWHITSKIWQRTGAGLAPMLVHPLLARRVPALAARARAVYQSARWNSPEDSRRPEVRRSMLHEDVLLTLEQAASSVQGAIVEIGAYVGGGTAAMARGLRSTGHHAPFASIEAGGRYLEHPHLPSHDIFADLTSFIASEGLTDRVELLRGRSTDEAVTNRVTALCAGNGIALLCIDADGQVGRDFRHYLPMCRAGALIAVDDYSSELAVEKTVPTRAAVDAAVEAGILKPLGLYGWGTWFGTVARTVTQSEIDALPMGGH